MQMERRWERWVDCAVDCKSAVKLLQQKQHRQVLFLDEWRLHVESVLHLKHEVSPDSSSANSTFGLCRGLMGGGRFVFLYSTL